MKEDGTVAAAAPAAAAAAAGDGLHLSFRCQRELLAADDLCSIKPILKGNRANELIHMLLSQFETQKQLVELAASSESFVPST